MNLPSLLSRSILAVAVLTAGAAGSQQQQQAQPAPKKTEQPKKKRVVATLSGFELEDPAKARKENTRLGATRSLTKLLAPQRARFYGGDALFSWTYAGKTGHFAVVFNDEGKEVFRGEAHGNEYRLPQKTYPFQTGKTYSWSVTTEPPLIGATPPEAAQFVVVSDAERAQIEKALAAIGSGDDYKVGIARAKLFVDRRLWFDAVGACTELIARFPDRADVYEQRGTIYSQLNATKPLAEADFARADQLQTRQGPKR